VRGERATGPSAAPNADGDLVREMLAYAAGRIMDAEIEARTGAAKGARTPMREVRRNGHRDRDWDTRAGRTALEIPKLRKGSHFPSFLEPRRTAEKALVAVIQEAYVHGVSTRSVDDLVKAMGAGGMSKSQVSRLCAVEPLSAIGPRTMTRDERVNAFLSRPLEGAWPYLWLDATYLKVREGGRIISRAVIIAVAVNGEAWSATGPRTMPNGKREVLGVATGPSEAATFWTDFLRSLVDRGLRGVKLVIADDHKGLGDVDLQGLLAPRQRAEVGHCPVQADQSQQALNEPSRLPECHAEQNLHGQAGLNRDIAAVTLSAALASGRAFPPHGGIQPDRQRASALERVRHCARTNGASMAHCTRASSWS
jgi:putative transposase